MCQSSFFDSNIFAAIIGAVIGVFSSLFVSVFYTGHQTKIHNYRNYRALLNGVRAEINHILKVIDEIKGILEKGFASTKRLNHDYLEHSRIKIIEFEDNLQFLESFTNAYRDIMHTNDMLYRLERDIEEKPTFIGNVQASMLGVKNSVTALQKEVEDKAKALKKPGYFSF